MLKSKAKVLFICGREPQYVRNAMIWQTLAQNFDSRLIADDKAGSLSFRLARLIPRLIYHLRQPHDLVVIGFYGHPLVPLARPLTRAPILFDAFVSTFDTLCLDRQIFSPTSLPGRMAFYVDKSAVHLADKVVLDTKTHAHYFEHTFQLAVDKLDTVYLGCDDKIFSPGLPVRPDQFGVFSYSSYLPLHGAETIVQAAKLCRDYPIQFRLVGSKGVTYQQTRRLAQQSDLKNVHFEADVPFAQLPLEIAQASVCLGGHFGATPKAGRVIAGKSYQFVAMGKPVILGDNPANRELFQHLQTAYFCRMNDPQALAEAIIHLYQNQKLADQLAREAYTLFQNHLTWQILSQKLVDIIQKML